MTLSDRGDHCGSGKEREAEGLGDREERKCNPRRCRDLFQKSHSVMSYLFSCENLFKNTEV